jgi:hypothetical protein
MASHKNQHFVPRCYLKPFTAGGSGLAISLLNVDRQRFIDNAPVKNQCSRDYFYGRDLAIEQRLQTLEGDYAKLLAQIEAPGFKLSDAAKATLCVFWGVQHTRTEAASQRMSALSNGLAGSIGAPAEYRMSVKEAVDLAMAGVGDTILEISDLKVALIRNRTSLPFVTCDDPAIQTNRWHFANPRTRGRSFGLGRAGALLMLPMSPRTLCLLYDGDVYSVPHIDGWADIHAAADASAFNEHQLLNARANIYFADWPGRDVLLAEVRRLIPRRPGVRHRFNFAVLDREEDGAKRYRVVDPEIAAGAEDVFIHSEVLFPEPTAWPTVIGWRKPGCVFSDGTALGFVRRARANAMGARGFRKIAA